MINNPIKVKDGMSVMGIYSQPLKLYINLDGKEEYITLQKK